ncbi:MAG: hypothetical protein ACRC7R_02965 [Sarcina sp.]
MEDYNKKNLGAGILTVTIIQLVIYALCLAMNIYALLNVTNEFDSPDPGAAALKIIFCASIAISIGTIIGLVFILFKKSIGIYLYFLVVLLNFIFTIMIGGFVIKTLALMLILPILTAIFIYRRRYVFNIGTKCAND